MDQQTRRFLALLGADETEALVERLAEGEAAKTELASELSLPARTVAETLDLMLICGLATQRKKKGANGGRPRELWQLRGAEELESLETFVKQMRKRLIGSD
jgi:predicted ArsR family transcriptional regulator